jgi:perosamine synthetase
MPMNGLALLGGERRVESGRIPPDGADISEASVKAVVRTLQSGHWSMFTSNEVQEFEDAFARYVGAEHAVLVNSCTTAILAALRANEVGPNDYVALPAFTYVGTGVPVYEVGARPAWVDVGKRAPNVDPSSLEAMVAKSEIAAAVVPLLFGCSDDVEDAAAICEASGTAMIFDCAQFLGDRAVTAKLATLGMCCFSFGESKILRIGEGGAVTTNSAHLAERVRRFRHEGEAWLRADLSRVDLSDISPSDVISALATTQNGLNLRPLAIAAALGRSQLTDLPDFLKATCTNAGVLGECLVGEELLTVPAERNTWWSYPCVLREPLERDVLLAALLSEGVPAGVHFPRLLPEHPLFARSCRKGRIEFPNASRFADRHIVLPIYPRIDPGTARLIGEVTREVLQEPRLLSAAARDASRELLQTARLAELNAGLYMFLSDR